jgi:hypothetical protein
MFYTRSLFRRDAANTPASLGARHAKVFLSRSGRRDRRTVRFTCLLMIPALAVGCKGKSVAPGAGVINNPLTVKRVGQEAANWCWAASAEMISNYYNKQYPQCKQVEDKIHLNGCCSSSLHASSPLPDSCNATGWPDFTFTQEHLAFTPKYSQWLS